MCGIVGVAGYIGNKEKEAFQDMLIFSQTRGPHSTGVASIDRKGNQVIVAKCLGRPEELIDCDKRYDKVVDYNKKFMLGHNRYATTGKVSKKNCHPFLFENILGCHNGTIPAYRLNNLKISAKDYETDSEAVLANINEVPMKEVFEKLDGAWAFVWFDARDNTLNFYRNKERTLFYIYSKDKRTIFWASERGFITTALERREIDFDKENIYIANLDTHMKWVIPDEFGKPFAHPVMVKVEYDDWQKNSQRYNYNYNHNNTEYDFDGYPVNQPYQNHTQHSCRLPPDKDQKGLVIVHNRSGNGQVFQSPKPNTSEDSTQATLDAAKKALRPEVKDFEAPAAIPETDNQGYIKNFKHSPTFLYRGFRGERLSKNEFEQITKKGCSYCDAPAVWGQPVRFFSKDEHLCLDCARNPTSLELAGITSKVA